MTNNNLKILDCTLRDGGYINNWKWGFDVAKRIIAYLVKAKIDIIEVGFLRDINNYNPDITVCNYIEELNRLVPVNYGNTLFAAMAMRSNYDVRKLSQYDGTGIELIRVTAHKNDIIAGMELAQAIKEKGYKVSINPINVMGYSDGQLLEIIDQVNKIQPYQFSIVDTFGCLNKNHLERIISIVDNNLDKNIGIDLHLHENMSKSCELSQLFLGKKLMRNISIDGSLMGIGRQPGNLPIELLINDVNVVQEDHYEIDYLLDAIQDYIEPLKGISAWGYSPVYFLSAKYNLHRNYAEFYQNKGDLSHKDINHILSNFDKNEASIFNMDYAEKMYLEYQNNNVDDTDTRTKLSSILENKDVLIIAPGANVLKYEKKIREYIMLYNPVVISVNFIPDNFNIDFAFFSNSKRIEMFDNMKINLIITSNINIENEAMIVDYDSLASSFEYKCNGLILLVKLLKLLSVTKVIIAGADGYVSKGSNYCSDAIRSNIDRKKNYNLWVSNVLYDLYPNLIFLTPSQYIK